MMRPISIYHFFLGFWTYVFHRTAFLESELKLHDYIQQKPDKQAEILEFKNHKIIRVDNKNSAA